MSEHKIRVGELIKETVATYVQQESNANPLITVTNVDISPDLRQAIIFVTTIPDDQEKEALIFLKRNGTNLRNYLKRHTRLKYVPFLDFMIDAGERHRQHMDELVREIENKKQAD